MKNKHNKLDNKLYKDINDMYDYVGFVTPDGGFYRVRQIGSANGEHWLFAYNHLESLNMKTYLLNYNDNTIDLVKKLHYVLVIESAKNKGIDFYPDYDELTSNQKNIIDNLLKYYNNKNSNIKKAKRIILS